jgi:hippurate hydrolase
VTAFARNFGEQRLLPMPLVTASEDIGVFGEAAGAPTVFWFWGGLDAQTATAALRGIQALVIAALTWLGTPGIRHTGTGGALCRAISSTGKPSR